MKPSADGLLDYYSSQAEVMLAQYRNVEALLGKTTHHTHSGTLCEVLLRDALRKNVLSQMSVDKGFVYGRIEHKEPKGHGPEIDILIHDTHKYRPLFRLEDFVVVQPEAVIAMIQVKKTLTSGEKGDLRKAIKNIAQANQHLFDLKVRAENAQAARRNWIPDVNFALNNQVFTAVVGYDDTLKAGTYRKWLLKQYKECMQWKYANATFDSGVFALPTFVGSLSGTCLVAPWSQPINARQYDVFRAKSGKSYISLQLLLWNLSQFAFHWRNASPPFSFAGVKPQPPELIEIPIGSESWFTSTN